MDSCEWSKQTMGIAWAVSIVRGGVACETRCHMMYPKFWRTPKLRSSTVQSSPLCWCTSCVKDVEWSPRVESMCLHPY